MVSNGGDAAGRHQPYYHVLVDHRDRPFQSTYVAQENIVRPTASGSSSSSSTSLGEASEVSSSHATPQVINSTRLEYTIQGKHCMCTFACWACHAAVLAQYC